MANFKTYLNVFIVSGFVSLITLTYLGSAFRAKDRPFDIPFELFSIALPLFYGLFGMVNYYVISHYGQGYSFLVGIFFGLFLSIIGRFGMNLPTKLFNFTRSNEYMVHIYAIIMYALIFQFIITPLTKYIVS